MSIAEQLIEMGFDKEKAEAAAKASDSLEAAVEWIMNNDSAAPAAPAAPTEAPAVAAASFVCNDCGKQLRNEDEIMFHASKTKHENFSESAEAIKPLTAEEKAQKVEALREKIRVHQEKKAKQEAEELREKERRRRDDGKAMIARKEELREREYREAAEKRRREKLEDDAAKRRVLEQIKLDREARQARSAGHVEAPKPVIQEAPKPAAPPKDYDATTIQIRLLNGQAVRQQFKAKEPLAMVRAWIDTNHANGASYKLMTPFPRKVFSDEDMSVPLAQLDLVPSANIVLTPQ